MENSFIEFVRTKTEHIPKWVRAVNSIADEDDPKSAFTLILLLFIFIFFISFYAFFLPTNREKDFIADLWSDHLNAGDKLNIIFSYLSYTPDYSYFIFGILAVAVSFIVFSAFLFLSVKAVLENYRSFLCLTTEAEKKRRLIKKGQHSLIIWSCLYFLTSVAASIIGAIIVS